MGTEADFGVRDSRRTKGNVTMTIWLRFQNSMRLLKTLDEEYLTQILPLSVWHT